MHASFRHNMEVAHRLSNTFPGSKCENIHGHSMDVTLSLHGHYVNGVLQNGDGEVFEFSMVKKKFRQYIDENFDHRLLLNREDPWAQPVFQIVGFAGNATPYLTEEDQKFLPGLQLTDGDPTTENLAAHFAKYFAELFRADVEVHIDETGTNSVSCMAVYDGVKAEAF